MAVDPSSLPSKAGAATANPYLLLGLQAGSLALAAGQNMAARRRLQSLRQPLRPQLTRNPLLSQRLAQAQQEAQLGTDLLRREREASTALGLERGRQVASQMGGATYGAMMQNQIAAADRNRRSGLVEDEQLRMQRQAMLDGLINQQMSEDARLDQMAMQDYGMQMDLFNQRLMMEEANRRQSAMNTAAAAGAIGADAASTFGQINFGGANQNPQGSKVNPFQTSFNRLTPTFKRFR